MTRAVELTNAELPRGDKPSPAPRENRHGSYWHGPATPALEPEPDSRSAAASARAEVQRLRDELEAALLRVHALEMKKCGA